MVVELQAFGLRKRSLQLALAHGRSQVEQRAGDRRDRDALVVGGCPAFIEETRAVQADPRGAVAAAGVR